MQTTPTLTGIELVKKLDAERTQGEWIKKGVNESYIRKDKDGFVICEFTNENNITSFEGSSEANAAYTVLACNNFASVVDTLNDLLKHLAASDSDNIRKCIGGNGCLSIIAAKQALNNIK